MGRTPPRICPGGPVCQECGRSRDVPLTQRLTTYDTMPSGDLCLGIVAVRCWSLKFVRETCRGSSCTTAAVRDGVAKANRYNDLPHCATVCFKIGQNGPANRCKAFVFNHFPVPEHPGTVSGQKSGGTSGTNRHNGLKALLAITSLSQTLSRAVPLGTKTGTNRMGRRRSYFVSS